MPTLAAKAATATIPIVFGVGEDPVRLCIVATYARPGGNATGINFFLIEVVPKRLRLLHDLVPKAVRVAVLLNPANASVTESTLRIVQEIAPTIGLQIQILNATTIGEINAAFATLERERPDALFVSGDAFFASRAVQFATLTARGRISATYSLRDYVAAGGLMSYGTDFTDSFRQVGVCCERPRYPTGEYPAPGLSRPPRNSGAVSTYRLNLIVLAYCRVVAASGGKTSAHLKARVRG